MSIYIQEGWGKSNKIDQAINDNSINGVVWSPRDEDPITLPATISHYKDDYPDCQMLFDPQFYVTTLANPRDGHLPDYPYYHTGLTRVNFNNPQTIQNYATDSLNYQATLPLDRILSPTVLFEDFRDPWSQVAVMMANASVNIHANIHEAPPLLISLVISEAALHSTGNLEEFLDAISILPAKGFYLIVHRSTPVYQAAFDPAPLENLIYLVYALAEINQFEVVLGYCDLVGLLMHAVGATATCAGWYQNLRQFTMNRFLPSDGGRQPKQRYSSIPLLNTVFFTDLDNTQYVGQLASVLSNTHYDTVFTAGRTPSNTPWSAEVSTLHHWVVLSQLLTMIDGMPVRQRIDRCIQILDTAEISYRNATQGTFQFDPLANNRHLRQWRQALTNFRNRAGI